MSKKIQVNDNKLNEAIDLLLPWCLIISNYATNDLSSKLVNNNVKKKILNSYTQSTKKKSSICGYKTRYDTI